MKVKFLGESDPLELINGKVYDVISIEDGWYRVVDETYQDYLFPPEDFEVVTQNDGSTPVLTLEECRERDRRRALSAEEEFGHFWTADKDDYALVYDGREYDIINREHGLFVLIEDSFIVDYVIEKMLATGNRIYRSINDALSPGTEDAIATETDRRFTPAEELLLERMKGSKLLAIDAVLAAPPDNSWNTVRLHFEEFDVDVNNFPNDIAVDEFGTLEEFGLLSVTESTKDTLSIPDVGTDTTVFEIGETVGRVSVINDIADIYGEGALVARLEYPQAVVLHVESGVIMLDKEVWFSELLVIKKGDNIEELLYDESVNWEDDPEEDPSTHFEFRTETQSL